MLKLSASLVNQRVVSLRTGGPVAIAEEAIINPHNLKIMGWWCHPAGTNQQLVLLADDIREVTDHGIAIDDEEELAEANDLVRHKEILEINYELVGKTVKTKRSRVGKVTDFSYNDGLFVQKLYVQRPLHKILSTEDTVLIDRNQIIEVTDDYILVRDTEVSAKETGLAAEPA